MGLQTSVKLKSGRAYVPLTFIAAKAADITVAVSPHYYYPTDHGWAFEGALENLMHKYRYV